jgi:exodeoxyribonuclease-3
VIPTALDIEGYVKHFYIGNKKGYSGTGVFVRSTLKPVKFIDGIGDEGNTIYVTHKSNSRAEHDDEGRVITIEFETYYVVNTYIPNSGNVWVKCD